MVSATNSSSLSGARVLVTGAGGFVGSHLVEKLVSSGARVTALFRYTSEHSFGALSGSPALKKITPIFGDIRDPETCDRCIAKQNFVFHLAAQVAIPYSYIAPRDFEDVNVRGTLNLLQSSRNNRQLKRFLLASSSEVYGAAKYTPMDENHPVAPQSPYAASKAAAEVFALAYNRSFDLPVTVTRSFNTFGPRQSPRAVIPTIITQALHGDNLKLGSTTPTRDFVFVDDITTGLINAAVSAKTKGEITNLCTGAEISVTDIVTAVSQALGKKLTILRDPKRVRPKNSEVSRLCGSGEKARKLFKYAPKVSFNDGIAETIKYFMEHPDLGDIREYRI